MIPAFPTIPAGGPTAWIRSLRPSRKPVDPWGDIPWLWETEREPPWGSTGESGGEIATLTLFLAGAECPFTCVFCDLWQGTLDGPTPPGALPAQIRRSFSAAGPLPIPAAVKLYNASNFFEPRAVPEADWAEILDLLAPFARVTVECHPRRIDRSDARALDFAARLSGSGAGRLEVAMGLETIHPAALTGLNKGMTLADYDRAAAILQAAGIGIRAFVLVGAPYVPAAESVDWAVRSAAYALEHGADRVSLIPLREGNGAMEALRAAGEWMPPALGQVESALERCLELARGIHTVDLWDVRRFATCPSCAEGRIARLARMNASGQAEPRVACPLCGGE